MPAAFPNGGPRASLHNTEPGVDVKPVGHRRGVSTAAVLAVVAALAVLAAGCGRSTPAPSSTPTATPQSVPSSAIFLAGQGLDTPSQEKSGLGTASGVTGGALFGGTANLFAAEPALGRKLAVERTYYRLGDQFPTPTDQQIMASGATLLVSLDTVPGQADYASIAAGQQDRTIRAFMAAVNAAAVRYHLPAIYFCFEHEADAPKTHAGLGSPAQFIAAWDHVHQLAASAHLNWQQGGRLHWVWILVHPGFTPLNARPRSERNELTPSSFWPGASEVDLIGVDGYNSVGCQANKKPATPAKIFGPAVDYAHSVGVPVFIAEWGGTPAGNQPLWIKEVQAFITANREVVAASYWDNTGAHCSYRVNGNPAALAALKIMGHAPALQGRLTG